MMAPPSACSGVMTSPSRGTLRIVASSGSRFMIKAVRNGPMRVVDMKMVSVAIAVQMLTVMIAAHPMAVCGIMPIHGHERSDCKI